MKIAETFVSIQGEGEMSGLPMFFVRTSGCSVSACPLHPSVSNLCDTDWAYRRTASAKWLAIEAQNSKLNWTCITGGEPTDQLAEIVELTNEVRKYGHRVMLQTSGARQVPDCWDWLVVSPKMHVDLLKQRSGHELKLVWNGESVDYLRDVVAKTRFLRYFLQPLDAHMASNIVEVANVVAECGRIGLPFRLGVQQHKLWNGK
jgi:7-carboxy-7-deazaguanine synthase